MFLTCSRSRGNPSDMSIGDELHQSLTHILRREMPKPPKRRWWERDDAEVSTIAVKRWGIWCCAGFTFA